MKRFLRYLYRILSLVLVSTLCTSCLTYFLVSSIVEASKKAKNEKTMIATTNQIEVEENNSEDKTIVVSTNQTDTTKDNDNIELLASGTGRNADEATTMALKNAIEQAFGAFVSANTLILNDEIVQDQIATVSSGNINSYDVLSTNTLPDGLVSVNLRTSVSLSNLISYAESHGSSVELAGQTFTRNIDLQKLNQRNEVIALMNLFDQLSNMQIYDYQLSVRPTVSNESTVDNEVYYLNLTIKPLRNPKNFHAAIDLISSTLTSISISQEEANELANSGFSTSYFLLYDTNDTFTRLHFRNRFTGHLIYNVLSSFFDCAETAWLIQFDNSQHSVYGPFENYRYYDKFTPLDNELPLNIQVSSSSGIRLDINSLKIEERTYVANINGRVKLSRTELTDIKKVDILPDNRAFQKDLAKMKKGYLEVGLNE